MIDFNKNRDRVLFRMENVTAPPDLYVADLNNLSEPTRLTNLNPMIKDSLQLADFDVVQWESSDGLGDVQTCRKFNG